MKLKIVRRIAIIVLAIIITAFIMIKACMFFSPEFKNYIRIVQYKTSPIGSNVKFGQYEQDGNLDNGPEDIEWIILAREDNKILLISKYSLLHSRYLDINIHDFTTDLRSWTNSNPRKILNEEFYYQAFSEKEQKRIALTTVIPDEDSTINQTDVVTYDHIFILSEKEVTQYFPSDSKRKCNMTKYEFQLLDADAIWSEWWLRSVGERPMCLAVVGGDGSIWRRGYAFNCGMDIRPAIWLYVD